MARWEDRFREHTLWATLKELENKLDSWGTPEDESTRESVEYAAAARAVASSREKSTPAVTVTKDMLTNSEASARLVIEQLEAFDALEEGDPLDLAAFDARTSALIASFQSWPAPTGDEVSSSISNSLTKLSASTSELISGLTAERDALAAKISDLEAEQLRLATKIAETANTNAQVLSKFETESDDVLNAAKGEWDSVRDAAVADAESKLASLAEWESRAEEIVHRTTGVATATDFGSYARQQGIVAGFFDFFAGAVGIAGVTSLIIHLYQVGESDSDLGLSLTRLAASLGTLGIAGIIGARAGQHHAEARAAKRTDLTLRRIEPFTANLDVDTRQAIIEETTARIFVRGELAQVDGEDKEIVERIRKRAADLLKRREGLEDPDV